MYAVADYPITVLCIKVITKQILALLWKAKTPECFFCKTVVDFMQISENYVMNFCLKTAKLWTLQQKLNMKAMALKGSK